MPIGGWARKAPHCAGSVIERAKTRCNTLPATGRIAKTLQARTISVTQPVAFALDRRHQTGPSRLADRDVNGQAMGYPPAATRADIH